MMGERHNHDFSEQYYDDDGGEAFASHSPHRDSSLTTEPPRSPAGSHQGSITGSECSYSGTDYGDDSWLENGSTPPWRKWSQKLQNLMDDPTGMDVFFDYLQKEGADNVLYLYLACDGLKKQSQQNHVRLVNSMYVKFIQADGGLWLLPETRNRFDQVFRSSGDLRFAEKMSLFETAQDEAWKVLEEQLYPNFMQSQKYSQYINEQEERYGLDGASQTSSSPPSPEPNMFSMDASQMVSRIYPYQQPLDSGLDLTPQTETRPFPSRPPPTPPPPLIMPPEWPNRPAGHTFSQTRQNFPEKDRLAGGAPAIPPRTSVLSKPLPHSTGLTREALQNSIGMRSAPNQTATDKMWGGGEPGQAYVKYAQFCMPSAQESELDSLSQVSLTRRSAVSAARSSGLAQQTSNSRRDALDFEAAKHMAKLNSSAHTDSIPLPFTEHQRAMGTLDPKSRDPRKNGPFRFVPEELASKLNAVIANREAAERNNQSVKPDPPTVPPIVAQLLAIPKTPSGRPKLPHVPPEADDSEDILNEHSKRVGETATPPSNNSVCTSPYPRLREPASAYSKASTVCATSEGGRRHGTSWDPPGQFGRPTQVLPPKPVVKEHRRPAVPAQFDFKPAMTVNPREVNRQFTHMNLRDISTDSGLGEGSTLAPIQPPHPFLLIPSSGEGRGAQPPKLSSRGPTIPPRKDNEGHQLQLKHNQNQGAASPGMMSRHQRSRNTGTGRSGNGLKSSVKEEEGFTVVWRTGQTGDFFMTKMTGRNCLKNFKNVLPANMNIGPATRYYFREAVPGTGTVWNEVKNDNDTLPLLEGRITATVEF
ncbi:uncharacterized protein LOC129587858 [Paramacrobiotus metropolitanus]|uniref:uncharacterized protein LOC129587858 n=1 Tax=Paramacrobiotus metropolitanus TaxID=2943436 RepID=UPI002445CA7B|nr:uncharacterized protein LOC129587858 [Paramacrobiotus metropolitanus]